VVEERAEALDYEPLALVVERFSAVLGG